MEGFEKDRPARERADDEISRDDIKIRADNASHDA